MNRRRFTPHLDDLETRQMLSVAAPAIAAAQARASSQVAPGAAAAQARAEAQASRASTQVAPGAAAAQARVEAQASRASAQVAPGAAAAQVEAQASRASAQVDRAEAQATRAQTAPLTPLTVDPDDPNVASLRQIRIDRLPAYLVQISRNQVVPPDLITALQTDLEGMRDLLRPPPSDGLAAFNDQLGAMQSQASVSPASAAQLNEVFARVLRSAEAPEPLIARFRENMNALAQAAIDSPNPSAAVAGNYALIMQMSMGVGLRSRTPVSEVRTPRR